MGEELDLYIFLLAQFLTPLLHKSIHLVTLLGAHICREFWWNPVCSLG